VIAPAAELLCHDINVHILTTFLLAIPSYNSRLWRIAVNKPGAYLHDRVGFTKQIADLCCTILYNFGSFGDLYQRAKDSFRFSRARYLSRKGIVSGVGGLSHLKPWPPRPSGLFLPFVALIFDGNNDSNSVL